MSKTQLVMTAVVLEGRSKSEVARDYDVCRYWVQQLVKRYETEGAAAFEPHSRRPTTIPAPSVPSSKTRSYGCGKPWTNKATTPARPPLPNT
jgi:transposase